MTRRRPVETLTPLRVPVLEGEDFDATDEERARWVEGERVCRKAFGVPDWIPAP